MSKGKGNSYDGSIVWEPEEGPRRSAKGGGRVALKTELGGIVLGMEEGWKGHEERES